MENFPWKFIDEFHWFSYDMGIFQGVYFLTWTVSFVNMHMRMDYMTENSKYIMTSHVPSGSLT